MVRSSLEAGDSPDRVARALIEEHRLLPISAIKALRTGSTLSAVEAKEVIKRNISPEQWAAAEPLWAMIAPEENSADGRS